MTEGVTWRDSMARWWRWFGARRIVSGVLGVPAVVLVAWWLLRVPPVPVESNLPYSDAVVLPIPVPPPGAASTDAASDPTTIRVHVVGAVITPGVYTLRIGARAVDALNAAGGALPHADLARINLAAELSDAVQLFVPRRGESRSTTVTVPRPSFSETTTSPAPVPATSPAPATSTTSWTLSPYVTPGDTSSAVTMAPSTGARVRLNVATAKELDVLPGIGPATAAAIIEHRRRNGPFRTLDDLDAVNGIGPARIAALRDLVVVD
jgi:competence protein ComEA